MNIQSILQYHELLKILYRIGIFNILRDFDFVLIAMTNRIIGVILSCSQYFNFHQVREDI